MENVTKKDKALELMKQLDIYQPYIDGFKMTAVFATSSGSQGSGTFRTKSLKQSVKKLRRNTTASFTLLRTNFLKATSCTAS